MIYVCKAACTSILREIIVGTYVFLTAMLPIFVDVGDKLAKLWKMTIGFKQSSEILVHEDLSKWVSYHAILFGMLLP